tara:strand:- start:816 stop:1205 length:390 start_codon:yes stop_codon:yes gene_type:complete
MSISRKTKTVKLLLNLFDQEKNAISVVDLVSFFSNDMNKTTVYRILNRLEESGVLHSFIDKDGLKRYARGDQRITASDNPSIHPHFLCEGCGISTCLPLKISTPSIPNYIINSSEQLYLGQCKDCQPLR